MRRIVIDFAEERPFWRMPGWTLERIRAALPGDWECIAVEAPVDGRGDGGARASAEALAAVASAEVYMGFGVPPAILEAAPGLRWAHSGTAGVGGRLADALRRRGVILTNSAGVHGPPIAESVLAAILYFARGLDLAVRGQLAGRWEKPPFETPDSPVRELSRSTVGVLGYGGIGREVARRVLPLGAAVLAVRRRPEPVAEQGVELLSGDAGLAALLERSDFLVLAAPLTPATRGVIDDAALARMRRDAVLINVSRGALVDEGALVDALRAGRLRGAALDVFAREPLEPGHAFWTLPNVLVTPHVAASSHHFWERQAALIEENVRRYLDGRELLNVVDTEAGY